MIAKLKAADIKTQLKSLPGWSFVAGEIVKEFSFPDYHHVMAFVNATAWISHANNHHPDLEVHYNKVKVRYSTHEVGGISDADFTAAHVIEKLLTV